MRVENINENDKKLSDSFFLEKSTYIELIVNKIYFIHYWLWTVKSLFNYSCKDLEI